MAGALDLARLDLEVGDGVGACTTAEHEVAVELVGGDAFGGLADQHVADPDRVRPVALQRALVGDVARAAGGGVVDEQPVLQVLVGVGEVQAEALRAGA